MNHELGNLPVSEGARFSRLQFHKLVDRRRGVSLVTAGAENILGDLTASSQLLFAYSDPNTQRITTHMPLDNPLVRIAAILKRLRLREGPEASFLAASSHYWLVLRDLCQREETGPMSYFQKENQHRMILLLQDRLAQVSDVAPEQRDRLSVWSYIPSVSYAYQQRIMERERLYDPPIRKDMASLQEKVDAKRLAFFGIQKAPVEGDPSESEKEFFVIPDRTVFLADNRLPPPEGPIYD